MPFTKTPVTDTYSSQKISLINDINWRDGGVSGKDEDLVNVFIETIRNKNIGDKRKYLLKRAGVSEAVPNITNSTIRGMHFWEDQSKLFVCINNDVHVVNVNTLVVTQISNPISTTSGPVGFCEYLYDNNTTVIIMTDGTTLIQIDSANTVTTCADADLPTPHLPSPVFLDGYLFLAKSSTADIYNSNLNNPMAWTAGDFISAEMEGDYIRRIAKLNNYLVAFGTYSIEYFWDAGNSPGSPMQRNETPIKINSFLGGWAQYGNEVIYIGKDTGGQPDVFILKDFKIQNIGSNVVTRYLNSTTDGNSAWTGNIIAMQGHVFYILNAGTTKTFICNLGENTNNNWTRIAWQNTNVFDITYATSVKTSSTIQTWFALDLATSVVYKFVDSVYQDIGTNFTCTIVTEPDNFGTYNRKMAHRLTVIADDPGVNSNVLVQWTDDDYQTYSTGVNVNLHADIPCAYRLGWFRDRAYKLTYTDNYPFRAQELEIDINKGTS